MYPTLLSLGQLVVMLEVFCLLFAPIFFVWAVLRFLGDVRRIADTIDRRRVHRELNRIRNKQTLADLSNAAPTAAVPSQFARY